jgi:hypothetical protein
LHDGSSHTLRIAAAYLTDIGWNDRMHEFLLNRAE